MSDSISIAERSQRFIEDNRPVLLDGEPAAINRMFAQAAAIEVELSREAVEATNAATEATNQTTKAVRNKSTPPVTLNRLEKERLRLTTLAAEKKSQFDAFDEFVREIEAAINGS